MALLETRLHSRRARLFPDATSRFTRGFPARSERFLFCYYDVGSEDRRVDLIEAAHGSARRHPWETARLSAILRLMEGIPSSGEGLRVLDVGCGDGFVSLGIASSPRVRQVTAIDIHLPGQRPADLPSGSAKVRFENRYDRLERSGYDLGLLLDILEHVEDDETFLARIASDFIAPGGFVLITVPACPSLYGSHDRYLGHHRRYAWKDLRDLVCRANLEHLCSGFLFFSPLLIRSLFSFLEKVSPLFRSQNNKGVGNWKGGSRLSWILDRGWRAENRLMVAGARNGMRIPGLTIWAVCKKPR